MASRYFIGGILILLGIGFFFDQLAYWDFSYIVSVWWPLIIILLGLVQLSKSRGSILTASIIIIIGILLQANSLGFLYNGFWSAFWPLVLILLGTLVLTKRKGSISGNKRHVSMDSDVSYNAFFSGIEQTIDTKDFRSASVNAMFGSVDLDMRDATISPQGAHLELNATFGGISIRLPKDCIVKTDGFPFFGALENKIRARWEGSEALPVVNIHYSAAFGGIEIKD